MPSTMITPAGLRHAWRGSSLTNFDVLGRANDLQGVADSSKVDDLQRVCIAEDPESILQNTKLTVKTSTR